MNCAECNKKMGNEKEYKVLILCESCFVGDEE